MRTFAAAVAVIAITVSALTFLRAILLDVNATVPPQFFFDWTVPSLAVAIIALAVLGLLVIFDIGE